MKCFIKLKFRFIHYYIIIIYYFFVFDMGKFDKSTKARMEHLRARQTAIYREMERLEKDKNVSDETLIHNYTKCFTTAVRQKKYNMAIGFADILLSYYRTYDMMSRALSLQNQVVRIEHLRRRQNLGRIADKKRQKSGGAAAMKKTVTTTTTTQD